MFYRRDWLKISYDIGAKRRGGLTVGSYCGSNSSYRPSYSSFETPQAVYVVDHLRALRQKAIALS